MPPPSPAPPMTGPAGRSTPSSGPAACTIVSADRLAHARVTAESFRSLHPEIPFLALVVDGPASAASAAKEPFEALRLDDLEIPGRRRFLFAHRRDELTCALTPILLAHLLGRGFDRVLFLKQETLVVGALSPAFERLRDVPLLLTPHLTAPVPGPEGIERELLVLLAGVFNAGVVGVSATAESVRFLAWWSERLATGCRHDVAAGWHFEQRWLDFAPSFLPGTAIERDPGLNCGHWSLPERRIEPAGDGWSVDGVPLRIFRLSGYDPEAPEWATRYARRLRVSELGPAAALFSDYRDRLLAAGHEALREIPWAFRSFDNGVPIPDVARTLLRDLPGRGDGARRFEDPFATGVPDSFYAYLNEPEPGAPPGQRFPTRLWAAVHRLREDLRAAFPDPFGGHREPFRAWTRLSGLAEHDIHESFLGANER